MPTDVHVQANVVKKAVFHLLPECLFQNVPLCPPRGQPRYIIDLAICDLSDSFHTFFLA
jgi:hypothetical protein